MVTIRASTTLLTSSTRSGGANSVHVCPEPRTKIAGMRYEVVKLTEVIRTCKPLIEANFAETGTCGSLKLDMNLYDALDDSPSFGIVAFGRDDKPVGMVSVFVSKHQHTQELVATNDTLYCTPEYRKVGLGGRLFLLAEKEAKARGVKYFQWAVHEGSGMDRALARRPYLAKQVTYFVEV